MRRFSARLICLGLLLAGVSAALGSDAIYLELDGAMQGDIEGEVVTGDFMNQILVLDFHHLVHRDLDPPGPKVHEEVIFTVRLNTATVKLLRAFEMQELMNICVFRFVAPQQENSYYQVELTSARIAAIEPISREVAAGQTEDSVRIRMGYAAIIVSHEGGTSATLINGKG